MMKEWIADSGQVAWAGFALVLFLALFAGMLIWVFRRGSSAQYAEHAKLPLED